MLIVDPEQRPTAEDIVEYIEQVGKAQRPVSGRILREKERMKTEGSNSLLQTIQFTDSMKDLQKKLPRHNYKLKAPPTSHHKSYEEGGRSEKLPGINIKPKNLSKAMYQPVSQASDYLRDNNKRSKSALSNKHAIDHKIQANHAKSMEDDRYQGSYHTDHDGEEIMRETRFLDDYDKALNHKVEYIHIENSVESRKSMQKSIANIKKTSSRGSRVHERVPSIEIPSGHDVFDDVKIEEYDRPKVNYSDFRRHRTEVSEERSKPLKSSSRYHLNHKINIHLNAIDSTAREVSRKKQVSEDYAKMLELEKKRKRLYKLLIDDHQDEITDMLKMHRRHRLNERHNSSSIYRYNEPKSSVPPTKYSKLPSLLVYDKSGNGQKAKPRSMIRNYHDQYKNSSNQYAGGQPRSVQPKARYHNPEWWG